MFLRLALLQEELHHARFARDCLIRTNEQEKLSEVEKEIEEIKEKIDRILDVWEDSFGI